MHPGEQTQVPLLHVRPFEVQLTQSAPPSPHVLLAVPSDAHDVPLMHCVQQPPPTHSPPLQTV